MLEIWFFVEKTVLYPQFFPVLYLVCNKSYTGNAQEQALCKTWFDHDKPIRLSLCSYRGWRPWFQVAPGQYGWNQMYRTVEHTQISVDESLSSAYGSSLSHSLIGYWLSIDAKPAMKWFLNVRIARSAALNPNPNPNPNRRMIISVYLFGTYVGMVSVILFSIFASYRYARISFSNLD